MKNRTEITKSRVAVSSFYGTFITNCCLHAQVAKLFFLWTNRISNGHGWGMHPTTAMPEPLRTNTVLRDYNNSPTIWLLRLDIIVYSEPPPARPACALFLPPRACLPTFTIVELLGSPYYKGVPLPRIPSVHKLSRYEVPQSPTVRTRICCATRYVFPREPINH